MSEAAILTKIHEDIEILKKDISEIKSAIAMEPKLKKEIKKRVEDARKRIREGRFVSNKDILEEFGIE